MVTPQKMEVPAFLEICVLCLRRFRWLVVMVVMDHRGTADEVKQQEQEAVRLLSLPQWRARQAGFGPLDGTKLSTC